MPVLCLQTVAGKRSANPPHTSYAAANRVAQPPAHKRRAIRLSRKPTIIPKNPFAGVKLNREPFANAQMLAPRMNAPALTKARDLLIGQGIHLALGRDAA